MGIFEHFPYVNFHELNLDWLIAQVKENKIDIEELKSAVDDLKPLITQEVDNVLNEWLSDGTIQTLLTNLVEDRQYMSASLTGFTPPNGYHNGDLVRTAGYVTSNDGGSGVYIINNSAGLPLNGVRFMPISGESARSYGVICDGVQDNASQIIIAMQYTNKLEFKPDDVIILSHGVPLVNNIHINGNGATVYVRNNNTFNNGSSIFYGSGLKNVIIENLYFQRDTGTYHFYALSLPNSDYLKITGCVFRNGTGYMIRISGSTNSIIENCQCYNVAGVNGDPGGFVYMQGGTRNTFKNLYCEDITDHVVYLDGTASIDQFTINDINATNQKTPTLTNGSVIAIYGDVKHGVISNIKGYKVETGIGIYNRNTITPAYITISNCEFNEVNVDGIEIFGVSPNPEVFILLSNILIDTVGQDGISLRYVSRCKLSNICISKAVRYAIGLSNATTNILDNCTSLNCLGAIQIGQFGPALYNVVNNSCDISCTYATNVSYAGSTNNRINCPTEINCANPVNAIAGNYIRNPAYTQT